MVTSVPTSLPSLVSQVSGFSVPAHAGSDKDEDYEPKAKKARMKKEDEDYEPKAKKARMKKD